MADEWMADEWMADEWMASELGTGESPHRLPFPCPSFPFPSFLSPHSLAHHSLVSHSPALNLLALHLPVRSALGPSEGVPCRRLEPTDWSRSSHGLPAASFLRCAVLLHPPRVPVIEARRPKQGAEKRGGVEETGMPVVLKLAPLAAVAGKRQIRSTRSYTTISSRPRNSSGWYRGMGRAVCLNRTGAVFLSTNPTATATP